MDGVENKTDAMKRNMDENQENTKTKMLELRNYMSSMILYSLDKRLSKGDIKMQGNHENV